MYVFSKKVVFRLWGGLWNAKTEFFSLPHFRSLCTRISTPSKTAMKSQNAACMHIVFSKFVQAAVYPHKIYSSFNDRKNNFFIRIKCKIVCCKVWTLTLSAKMLRKKLKVWQWRKIVESTHTPVYLCRQALIRWIWAVAIHSDPMIRKIMEYFLSLYGHYHFLLWWQILSTTTYIKIGIWNIFLEWSPLLTQKRRLTLFVTLLPIWDHVPMS